MVLLLFLFTISTSWRCVYLLASYWLIDEGVMLVIVDLDKSCRVWSLMAGTPRASAMCVHHITHIHVYSRWLGKQLPSVKCLEISTQDAALCMWSCCSFISRWPYVIQIAGLGLEIQAWEAPNPRVSLFNCRKCSSWERTPSFHVSLAMACLHKCNDSWTKSPNFFWDFRLPNQSYFSTNFLAKFLAMSCQIISSASLHDRHLAELISWQCPANIPWDILPKSVYFPQLPCCNEHLAEIPGNVLPIPGIYCPNQC